MIGLKLIHVSKRGPRWLANTWPIVVPHHWHTCINRSRWANLNMIFHDDVIKWKHFPRYWPFVRGIHRSPVNSPHKGQWRGALMFSLICTRIDGWVNNGEAGDLRRYRAHYDVTVMFRTVFRRITFVLRFIEQQILSCLLSAMIDNVWIQTLKYILLLSNYTVYNILSNT